MTCVDGSCVLLIDCGENILTKHFNKEINMEQKGIVQTKEALVGLMEISVILAEILKDGAQTSDLITFWQKFQEDVEIKKKLLNAFVDISNVPTEVSDLDVAEVVELVSAMLPYVSKLVLALRKS